MNGLEKKVITEIGVLLESFEGYHIYKALSDFADQNNLECRTQLLETYNSAMNREYSKIRKAKEWIEEMIKNKEGK